jgi:predicted nucleic acid-binding protein
MYTFDANIFVRDLDTSHTHYPACHMLLERVQTAATPIIDPLIVLAEIAGAISRELHDPMRGRIYVGLLRTLPNLQLVALDDALADAAAEIAADLGLRGMDAIYVATARRHGCTFVTLDEEPLRRAGAIIPVSTPAQALTALDA